MSIWFDAPILENVNSRSKNTLMEHLEITFVEIGEDYLKATMPVDQRTVQPLGLLHGGASAALAESLGSVAANMCLDNRKQFCVGLEINLNHIRSVKTGLVHGISRPLHLGKTTQVWEIKISRPDEKLVSVSRLTLAVLNR